MNRVEAEDQGRKECKRFSSAGECTARLRSACQTPGCEVHQHYGPKVRQERAEVPPHGIEPEQLVIDEQPQQEHRPVIVSGLVRGHMADQMAFEIRGNESRFADQRIVVDQRFVVEYKLKVECTAVHRKCCQQRQTQEENGADVALSQIYRHRWLPSARRASASYAHTFIAGEIVRDYTSAELSSFTLASMANRSRY